jgi:hypothetical protein
MKQSAIFIILFYLSAGGVKAQSKIDTVAVSVLDRMSAMIGELTSCSATVKSCYDVGSPDLGLIKHSDVEHIYVSGPDKMFVTSEGDMGGKNLSYDGKTFSYYSPDKNYYAQISTPSPSVIETIEYMNKNYGITFPAADFLYPGFVDDILAEANNLVLLGMTEVEGKNCFHIAGTAKDKTFQFWISEAPFYLPVKLVIVNTEKAMNPQFESTYSDWQLNPNLPGSVFEFKIPQNARKIKMVSIAAKK